ncbi:MAG: hypothetical protein ABIZ80_09345 [Bryobacteraceae bacterium]
MAKLLTGGDFGLEASIITTLVEFVLIGSFVLVMKRKRVEPIETMLVATLAD